MAKKYYAIRKGRKTGIFESWDECKAQVTGFSGAEYKSFKTIEEAELYIKKEEVNEEEISEEFEAIAYVDGSYDKASNMFSCGVVIFYLGKEYTMSKAFDDKELRSMNNVAGELKGSELAMNFCIENNIKSIKIHHDYEGIAKWCTGDWQAKKFGTKQYRDLYFKISKSVRVEFVKVKAHSGNKYNDLADKLARSALNKV